MPKRLLLATLRYRATSIEQLTGNIRFTASFALCTGLNITCLFFGNVDVCSYHICLVYNT